jgi:hypothetical protein
MVSQIFDGEVAARNIVYRNGLATTTWRNALLPQSRSMRFHLGPIPLNDEFQPEQSGWTPLREPSPALFQWIVVPIGFVTAVALGFGWSVLIPSQEGGVLFRITSNAGNEPAWWPAVKALIVMGGGFMGLIAVHELIHAAGTPRLGWSPQTIIGFWPTRLVFYAAYLGPLSRNRFVLVFLLPLIVLSILPLIGCAVVRFDNSVLKVVSIVNGFCACGDILGAALILYQVPGGALVQNQGWNTWWKPV